MNAYGIEVTGLTKRFGEVTAVDSVSFAVEPGVVTGFLGPNGAGKTTTMRMILGLVTPTEGTATIGGRRYTELDRPTRTVGCRPRRRRLPPQPLGPRPPADLLRDGRPPRQPGGRAAGPPRPRRARPPPHPHLLHRHEAAAQPRHRAPRRPERPAARRAEQRPRPRGHRLAPHLPARTGRRGPHGPRLQPCAQRGPADRRRRRGDPARPDGRRRTAGGDRAAPAPHRPGPLARRRAGCGH